LTALEPRPAGAGQSGAGVAGDVPSLAGKPVSDPGSTVTRPRREGLWGVVDWLSQLPTATDRAVLRLWLLTRVTVFLLVGAAAYAFPKVYTELSPTSFLARWANWDFVHFRTIAAFGYGGNPKTGPVVPLEALFLALALSAWLAARKGNWPLAGFLVAGAAVTRVTGIFLAAALVVEFLTAKDGRRRWRELPWLAVPVIPLLIYMVYLYQRTGDIMAWNHAQSRGWGRKLVDPISSFFNTWDRAFNIDGRITLDFVWMYRIEIIAMAIGVVLLVWLLRRHRWGEATYIFLNLVAFGTSTTFFSVPRATLLWWPLWIGLAAWSLRRPSVKTFYFTVVAPFMVMFTLMFATDRWSG
jgi:hypothetical protein